MKASKFSDAQKAFILKHRPDAIPVAEICRHAGISQVCAAVAKLISTADIRRIAVIRKRRGGRRWVNSHKANKPG